MHYQSYQTDFFQCGWHFSNGNISIQTSGLYDFNGLLISDTYLIESRSNKTIYKSIKTADYCFGPNDPFVLVEKDRYNLPVQRRKIFTYLTDFYFYGE